MIIAKQPIIVKNRLYKKGEALPGDSPLVSVWLENGAAYDDSVKKVKAEPASETKETKKKK